MVSPSFEIKIGLEGGHLVGKSVGGSVLTGGSVTVRGSEGDIEGPSLGCNDGPSLGKSLGNVLGEWVGSALGVFVGSSLGASLGTALGD